MKNLLLGLAAITISGAAWAQAPHVCGTDEMRRRLIAEDPSYLEREAAYAEEIRRIVAERAELRNDEMVLTIPIVFHILHQKGTENISNEQILDQVEILNRDFRKLNTDQNQVIPAFQSLIGDTRIEFALPTKDGYGNCHNGIDRIRTVGTFLGQDRFKRNQWPRDKYLNVWVTRDMESGTAGYAYYPEATAGFLQIFDGIMQRHNYTGSIGTSNVGFSRTLTHEIGHYLNLMHPWGSGDVGLVCGDDGVEDTPLTRGFSGCPSPENSVICDRPRFDQGTVYSFDDVTTSSGTTDPTPPPSPISGTQRITLSPFTATGVSSNSSVPGQFAFTNWGVGAEDDNTEYSELTGTLNTGKYYAFVVTRAISDVATVDTIRFKVNRNETGIRTFAVRASVGNFSSNLPLIALDTLISVESDNVGYFKDDTTVSAEVRVVLSSNFADQTQPLTFRFYGWNAEDTDGTFVIDDVVVRGTAGAYENYQNYMDYSYCSRMFTLGQVERMRASAFSAVGERSSLWTESNLAATGVTPGSEANCPPEADFYAVVGLNVNNPEVPFNPLSCTNTNVRFVDNSYRSFPTTWSWTFEDGTPATSSERNPIVQFNSPGHKRVTLTVTNEHGSTSKTDDYAVLISDENAAWRPPYTESFEQNPGIWPFHEDNHDGNHTFWQRHSGAGASGTHCVRLNSGDRAPLDFINPGNGEDMDDLVTPNLNLHQLPNGTTLSFFYSYSTRTTTLANVTEKLEVFSSTNCGRSWILRATISGQALVTNGAAEGTQNWVARNITLPLGLLTNNVRFRFRFTSSEYSGDLFLDDISIGAPVGIDDADVAPALRIFPNPTNDIFNVQVAGMETFPTQVMVQDMRGSVVYSDVAPPQGGMGIEISSRDLNLAEGVYVVRTINELGSSAQKIIVGR